MLYVLYALLTGAASALAFEPVGWWPLMLVAFAIMCELICRARSLWIGILAGFAFGFGQFVVGLNWIATAFTFQAAMPPALGWVAVVLAVALSRSVSRARRRARLALRPQEPARVAVHSRRRVGHHRMAPRHALHRLPVEPGRRGPRADAAGDHVPADRHLWTVGSGGAAGRRHVARIPQALAAVGGHRRRHYDAVAAARLVGARKSACRTQRFASFSPISASRTGGVRGSRINPHAASPGSRARLRPSRACCCGPNPRSPSRSTIRARNIRRSRKPSATRAASVAWRQRPAADRRPRGHLGRWRAASTASSNSVFVLGPGGRMIGRYDKAHLVPYGEYLPMRSLLSSLGLARLAPGDIDFTVGPGPRTIDLGGQWGKVGFQLCYEIIFSGRVVDQRNRPGFIFNPSNDAWFGTWGPPQHLAQARLRAAEEGLPVIRATPTGISAVIDAKGKVLKQIGWQQAGVIDSRASTGSRFAANLRALRQPDPAAARSRCCLPSALCLAGASARARSYKDFLISQSQESAAGHAQLLSLHVRIRFRRPSRQGRRPDFTTPSSISSSAKDPEARVACETLTTTQQSRPRAAKFAGAASWTKRRAHWAPGASRKSSRSSARRSRTSAMSRKASTGKASTSPTICTAQSAHIAQGVDRRGNKDEGAGDQGIMFGYATDETPELLPATLYYSHKILERMAADRHSGAAPFLEPDAKSQVTLALRGQQAGGRDRHRRLDPARQGLSTRVTRKPELHAYVKRVVADVIPGASARATKPSITSTRPAASRSAAPTAMPASPAARSSSTPMAARRPHGGGAFSGKDPTKVDRSAAYMARYLAKNIVAAGLATRCTIQLAYAIGVSRAAVALCRHPSAPARSATTRSRRPSAASRSSAA